MDVLNMDDLEILFTKKDVNLPDPNLLLMYKALTKRHIWLDFDISWESVHLIVKYIQYFISTDNVIRQFEHASLLKHISNDKIDKIIKEYNAN